MPRDRSVLLRSSKNSFQSAFLRARTRSLNSKSCTDLVAPKRHSPLPLDIIELIVHFFIEKLRPLPALYAFTDIIPLTLVSSECRLVALRQFLRHLSLDNVEAWDTLWKMIIRQENKYRNGVAASAGLNWTRSLSSTSQVLAHHSWRISFFSKLQALSINLSSEGLATQHTRMKQIFSGMEDVSLSDTLTSLYISAVPRIDMPFLCLISERFSALTTLHITCTERISMTCCWICFEDSLTCTAHSPIPDFFPTAEDFARSVANALAPLKNLTYLRLGIFLCDEQVIWDHMDHASAESESVGAVIGSAHECNLCQPFAREIRRRELAASLIIARRLRALKNVIWDSFYGTMVSKPVQESASRDTVKVADVEYQTSERAEDDSIEQLEITNAGFNVTSVWIWRDHGRLRAKAAPWVEAVE